MNKFLSTLCSLGLCVLFAGCGGRGYSGDQRFPLSGKVTYDGQPIDWGSVSFIPQAGDKQRASGGVIADGTYSVPEEKGVTAGKYRIEIHWGKLTGKQVKAQDSEDVVDERIEGLPDRFHKNSELTVEVPSADNTYSFDLKSE